MATDIQSEILRIIRKKPEKYPVTISELVEELDRSNGVVHKHVKILEKKGLIEGKRVARPKGGVTYYKTTNAQWPKYLGRKCSECKNKSKNRRCTYHDELAERGIIIRADRVKAKLTKNTVACDDFIEVENQLYSRKLEVFLDENRRITETENGFRISYHCANEKCQAELTTLGNNYITKLGSSVLRCENCDTYYKTLFDKKKEEFRVHYNIENGVEYKENFTKATGGGEPGVLYSSDKFGIVIHDLRDASFNFRTKTMAVNNWIGKLNDIKYVVAKRKEDYETIVELLNEKGYREIDVILGVEKLVSPPPVKQHIGLLRLLREIKIVNKEFCIAMLLSRITVIEKINEQFKKANEIEVKRARKKIEELILEVNNKRWITAKEWNLYEMRAGKEMWGIVRIYLKKLGIDFPGRVDSRLVTDMSIPYKRFFAYSAIDTLINGEFGIAGEFVKEYLMDIEFCWDGLPGICHGKTRGGVFGFHLDMREQEKILTLPYLLETLQNEMIEVDKIQHYRGRNRQKIFYVKHGTELEEQIREIIEEMKRGKINGRKTKNGIREYYLQGKQWVNNFYRRSNYYEIEHHGEEYLPWAVMKEKVWEVMGREEQERLVRNLRREHRTTGFRPLTIRGIN